MSYKLSKAVDKATDATLLADNWQYILDVCDVVDEEPESGAKEVIQLVSTKLQQRDANVQLRTLSLLTSLAENCGSRVKQEIATKSFTSQLLGKLQDHSVHKEIKIKIVQVFTQLSKSFQNDPSLKPIQDSYRQVEQNYSQYFPPDKPQKRNLDNDRLKEEEDLKAAIALSLAENNQASIPTQQDIQQQQQQQQVQQIPQQQQQPSPISKAQPSFSRVRALYDSFSQDPADLHFRKGDIITVLDRVYKDWGKGSLRGEVGLFPFNYVTPLYDPTPEELQLEISKEVEILNKSRKVEKLLTLLSNNDDSVLLSNEFQQLYQETVLIKPELGGLIEKYRVRRDELLDLHGKLKDASNKYESLTDPLKHNYGKQNIVPQVSGYQNISPQYQRNSYQFSNIPQSPGLQQQTQPLGSPGTSQPIGNIQQTPTGNIPHNQTGNIPQQPVGNLQQHYTGNIPQLSHQVPQHQPIGNIQQQSTGNIQHQNPQSQRPPYPQY